MSDLQIQEIQKTRTAAPNIKIYSPVTGYILARDISPEQRFDKGTEFYRIADITHVWIETDIFEKDREFIKPGTIATIRYQGLELQAHMSNALPQFNPESRILKTRFELNNPGSMLLPGMFVEVELQMETPEAITVPDDAVIDSGRRKTVYVERGNGMFEPRLVETGWHHGNQIQITQGLSIGERIAVSGNFLIDSESRMKAPEGANPERSIPKPTAKQADKAKDLVCGMTIDPGAAGTLKTQYKGKTYYFCSKQCKTHFEATPEEYIHPGMATPDMHTHTQEMTE
jgi:Cu(I)/Ag(I) efflux system membrane fusion protein